MPGRSCRKTLGSELARNRPFSRLATVFFEAREPRVQVDDCHGRLKSDRVQTGLDYFGISATR